MKKFLLRLVAVFEIVCAIGGGYMIYQAFSGDMPTQVVPMLWYGVFPLLSLAAGIALLLNKKYGVLLSIVAIALQIPLVVINGITILRVAIAFNLYLSAFWNARSPEEGTTVLGLNALAIVMMVVLLTSRSAAERNDLTPQADN